MPDIQIDYQERKKVIAVTQYNLLGQHCEETGPAGHLLEFVMFRKKFHCLRNLKI